MKYVLLSGGSGKRLWPLSNDLRSKQFIKLLMGPLGLESMIQRVWRQLSQLGMSESSYISTSKGQVEILQGQLGTEIPLIVEPCRRDTFPAIVLAVTYLYSIEGVGLDETITILPVDPYVEDSFFNKIKDLDRMLTDSDASLALIGVKPTCPTEKYGYIVPESTGDSKAQTDYIKVRSFKEKPDQETAARLISDGALWNCGVLAFKLGFFIDLLIRKGIPIQYDELLKQYESLPQTSIDYEIVEHAEKIVVSTYEGSWKDIGTWNALTEEMQSTTQGKAILAEDCEGTHIINELGIQVIGLGLSNIIIAASPDGILVSDKSSSPQIKQLLKDNTDRPMYEERRWGGYRVVDFYKASSGMETLTKRVLIKSGHNLSYHRHLEREEIWNVINGQGEVMLDEALIQIQAGDVIKIAAGSKHSIHAITDLDLVEIQYGSALSEEDIIRFAADWDEILSVQRGVRS